MNQIKTAVIAIGTFTLLLGVVYPTVMVLVAMVVAPTASSGSLIQSNGKNVGSELIGQPTPNDTYFYNRPSAASYGTIASGASNLGPLSKALHETIAALRDSIAQRDGVGPESIANDLLTSSGSGVDPHISPVAAQQQVARIARLRGISATALKALISNHTQPPTFGFLGRARVNVLSLNLALDEKYSIPRTQ